MKLPFKKKTRPELRRRPLGDGYMPMYSYHNKRSTEREIEGRPRLTGFTNERVSRVVRYSARRIGAILAGVAVVISIISTLLLSTTANLQVANPNSFSFHSQQTYQAAANAALARSFASHTKVTIDTGAVSAALKKQFPELAAVSVKLPLINHRPIVYLVVATPSLIMTMPDGTKYAMDDTGRVLGAVHVVSVGHTLLLTQQTNLPITVGAQALPPSTVSFINEVTFQLQQKHLTVASFSLPPSSSELDLHIEGLGYFVKFNLENPDAQQQAGTFLATKHYLEGQGVTRAQYIDVRIDGRAYYK